MENELNKLNQLLYVPTYRVVKPRVVKPMVVKLRVVMLRVVVLRMVKPE